MSGQGNWSLGLWKLYPEGGIHDVNPHPRGWAQYLGPNPWNAWWGQQTVPLARLSEKNLGMQTEGTDKATYKKALEVGQK